MQISGSEVTSIKEFCKEAKEIYMSIIDNEVK